MQKDRTYCEVIRPGPCHFFIDIDGHIDSPGVKKSLEELGLHTESLDILGVYEADKFRFSK